MHNHHDSRVLAIIKSIHVYVGYNNTEMQVSMLFIQPRAEGPRLCKMCTCTMRYMAVTILMHPHGSNDSGQAAPSNTKNVFRNALTMKVV